MGEKGIIEKQGDIQQVAAQSLKPASLTSKIIVLSAASLVVGGLLWAQAWSQGLTTGREQMEPSHLVPVQEDVYHTPDGERLPLWRMYPRGLIGHYPLLVEGTGGDELVNIDIRSEEDILKFHRHAVRNRNQTTEYFENEVDSLEQETAAQVGFLRARLDTILREHTAMESTMIYEYKDQVKNLKARYHVK